MLERTNAKVTFPGGYGSARVRLAAIEPAAYARTRNFLDGAVTRLSPYLRHGVLTLVEVRDAAFRQSEPKRLFKFVQELAWRDYYVRVRALIGDRIWDDLEPYKTGRTSSEYLDELPSDISEGSTGLMCIDGFVRDLLDTGYVHNHARMWFASYVVHFRGVRWQAGAEFYLAHLLDGDPASNNLSWQWVASTFAYKPYIFNRTNIERYTKGTYCGVCPLAHGGCPFATSYAKLDAQLFPNGQRAVDDFERQDLHVSADVDEEISPARSANAIVWQHEESLSVDDAARRSTPASPAIFVWDAQARARDPWSAARITFVQETLADLGLARIASGDGEVEIARFAREHGASTIVTTAPVDPRLREIADALSSAFHVIRVPAPRLVTLARETDLGRFSRYWPRAQSSAFGPGADSDAEPLQGSLRLT